MLTDYERLAEFVPNLALSEQIPLAPGSPPNLVRLRQVGTHVMLEGSGPRVPTYTTDSQQQETSHV